MKKLLVLLHDTFGQFKLTVHSDAWARPIGLSVTHPTTGRSIAYYPSTRTAIRELQVQGVLHAV